MISFHIECARRANYFMEIEKGQDKDQQYKIFCEKHRPFKIVKEIGKQLMKFLNLQKSLVNAQKSVKG